MKKISTLLLSATALACQIAGAQSVAPSAQSVAITEEQAARPYNCEAINATAPKPLVDAICVAINTNPDVLAKYHAFAASVEEIEVARGLLLPRVDLNAEVARKSDKVSSRVPESQSMTVTGLSLTATQLLWDGLASRYQVDRFSHASLTRYFEFREQAEQTALETVRAFVDVQRANRLVEQAELNSKAHQSQLDDLSRGDGKATNSGDINQAKARRDLADSNLTVERSNQHDAMERFRRITGSLPSATPLDFRLQDPPQDVTQQSVKQSSLVQAAIQNYLAVQAQLKEADGKFQPRVDASVRTGVGNNMDGIVDKRSETKAGVNMSWNLFAGGSDQARVNQQTNLLRQAFDQLDRACRDVRLNATVAANDVSQLGLLMKSYEDNTKAANDALTSFQRSNAIGGAVTASKRQAIDLLNARNELYTATRSRINAEYDQTVARARVLATGSRLLSSLGIGQNGQAAYLGVEQQQLEIAGPQPASCIEPVNVPVRAEKPAAAPLADIPSAKPVAGVSDGVGQVIDQANPTFQPVMKRLKDWASAWESKNVPVYIAFYDEGFKPAKVSRETWLENRSRLLRKDGAISVKISREVMRTVSVSPHLVVETTFDQSYSSSNFKDSTRKILRWRKRDSTGTWFIIQETSEPKVKPQ
jgi:adhesin transport system outer membrane protein